MAQLVFCIILLTISSVVILCESYTIVYKNSQNNCRFNRYSHIYDYLDENTYCFQLRWCDEEHCCVHECGAYPSFTKHISIFNTELIPPNAFTDSEKLLHITGIQQNIATLASRSFVNLYNITDIHLSFNKIKYIQHDVFVNVSADVLDLSWNELIYIDQDAFGGLPNLKVLNLTHNQLSYIYAFPKDSVLTELILSHNYLQRLVISSVRYPDLKVLHADYNNLTNIAITSKNQIEIINLAWNELKSLDVFDVENVRYLNIGHNKFSEIDISICQKVKDLSLLSNPLDCSKLQEITSTCSTTEHLSNDACEEFRREYSKGDNTKTDLKYCIDDSSCPDDQICRTNQCVDPCSANSCDPTSVCKTENHVFRCECLGNSMRNPLEFHSQCHEVECFVDEDCPKHVPCNQIDHVCDKNKVIHYSKASSVVRTYPWYYDEGDSVLGLKKHEQNFHRTESKNYHDKAPSV